MPNLTLQINSKQALERLIGGDSELEVTLRNNIVQEFAKTHLKKLVPALESSTAFTELKNGVRKEVTKAIQQQTISFKEYYAGGGLYDVKLRPEIQEVIDREVKKAISGVIRVACDEALAKYTEEFITKVVAAQIDHNLKVIIGDKVKERLKDVMSGLAG